MRKGSIGNRAAQRPAVTIKRSVWDAWVGRAMPIERLAAAREGGAPMTDCCGFRVGVQVHDRLLSRAAGHGCGMTVAGPDGRFRIAGSTGRTLLSVIVLYRTICRKHPVTVAGR